MKFSSLCAASVAGLVLSLAPSTPAWGQNAPPQSAAPQRIAVIDINAIFKSHPRFQGMKNDMQRDITQAQQQLKAMQDEIRQLAETLEGYQPGSPEYKELESRVANRQAEAQVQMKLLQKEFMQREAKMYYTIYKEVLEEVRLYATQHGISLVIRVTAEEPDPNDPQQVADELKKSVVFHHDAINLTAVILDVLNRRQPQQPASNNDTYRRPQQVGARPAPPQAPAGNRPVTRPQ